MAKMREMSAESNGNVWEDPIAIVGMGIFLPSNAQEAYADHLQGCRYPGDATSPSKLWDLLDAGRSGLSTVPPNRFNIDAWYHPDSQRPGGVSAKGGYFISQDDSFLGFDPSFFGINPKEAATMDPQQRKLLEVVYECFESAGVTLEQLSGSQTGCYVGCFTLDSRLVQNRDIDFGAPYKVTVSDCDGLRSLRLTRSVGRWFDNYKQSDQLCLQSQGPQVRITLSRVTRRDRVDFTTLCSVSIDTACSSSLYALHLACQALLTGDCSAAIVGGTNIILDIDQHLDTMRLGVLSPTSTCHTFDESADGFGRAEGIAAIYIKRLSDAMTAGDPVRAVIRATAVNA
jgi:acyl transferase domain-containing protein